MLGVVHLTLGRDICGGWNEATGREWLVTNGLGGYACGTIAGANTRRYHGLLMASLEPPTDRTLLVAKVDVSVRYLETAYPLAANEFAGSVVDPRGFIHLESFTVVDGVPIWRYAVGDALLEQRIFMAPGANTSYLRFELLRASAPMNIELKPLVTYRGYHEHSRGARPFTAIAGAGRCTIKAFADARPYRLTISAGDYAPADTWYWNFLHREEFGRGLDALEDLWGPGLFRAELAVGHPLFFTASAEDSEAAPGHEVLAAVVAESQRLRAALPRSAPPWVHALATASNQFIVKRVAKSGGAATSIIAGYPWFTDWGRDTMIALPGLALATGRYDLAKNILLEFAGYVDRGMLPNRFPDA